MSKYAVIYWSGTGNTEAMANAVVQGVKDGGAEADLMVASAFTADKLADYEGFAFGCSSCGAEELEESEFRPMWDSVLPGLKGKKVVLFGSYGWGGGAYLDDWKGDCAEANLVDCYLCENAPEEEHLDACKALGKALLG